MKCHHVVFGVFTAFTIKHRYIGGQLYKNYGPGHDELGHLSIWTSLENIKWPKMVVVDLVADNGNTDRAFADQ